MRIRIAYYSGSGNTQYVALLLRKYLSFSDISTHFIKKNRTMDEDFDSLILGTPVYAYRPPYTVIEFAKRLSGNGRKAYIFITKGLISGDTGKILADILKQRGFKVVGITDILMADSLFILLAKRGSLFEKIMLLPNRNIENRVRRLCGEIESRLNEEKEIHPRSKWYVPFTLAVAGMFWKKEKKWQKAFLADERCDLCGACVGLCPTGNIKIEGSVVRWGNNCDFCVRCLHRCPQKAIQIGHYTQKSPRYRGP